MCCFTSDLFAPAGGFRSVSPSRRLVRVRQSFLFGDPPRASSSSAAPESCRGLLDQFVDAFPHSGNALPRSREVQRNVSHGSSP
jgi:hypothetical protein